VKFLVPLFALVCLSNSLFAGTDMFIGWLGCMTSGDPSFFAGLQYMWQSFLILFACAFLPPVFLCLLPGASQNVSFAGNKTLWSRRRVVKLELP
jgi:hypothetical protein